MGQDHWPTGHVDLTSTQALFVGTLLLIAAAGKSALVPFSVGCHEPWKVLRPAVLCFTARLSVHSGGVLLPARQPAA